MVSFVSNVCSSGSEKPFSFTKEEAVSNLLKKKKKS
jgi:hypothetical protein